jgi:16S rRNA (uracil1498-N3)-methyltransferase
MAPRECKGPRLFVEELSQRGVLHRGSEITLPEESSHYIRNVLRIPVGEAIEIADPATGDSCVATITSLTKVATVTVTEKVETPTRKSSITILCALCKGQKNELICDWATELGCSRIIFWQSERSIMRLKDPKDASSKELKFANASLAAAQQSRQPTPPEVRVALSLHDALALLSPTSQGLKAYCSLEEGAPLLSSISNPHEACLVIGPEGDLTPKEMETLRGTGFRPVSLGREVLRSELAVVTAVVTSKASRSQIG